MERKIRSLLLVAVLALLVATPVYAGPGKPDFSPSVYADGEAWGTKVTTTFKGIRGNNQHSFDRFFVFTNGVERKLPVGEAAPGNPACNGGRWWTWTATWIEDLPHDKVLLTSYMEEYADDPFYSIEFHLERGHIILEEGSPGPPPPDFFQCPLLPVK